MDGHNEVPTTSRGNDEVFDRIPTHFLVELTSLDELAFPANSTKRVKYTCVASTSKCLCLGTSTGSVYIFSRYAAKSRSRTSSPVPVQVFTTRDGQISTISVSASEELMAIGGDSGRVSIAQLNNGQPPTLIYSTPGDARSPDRVMALAWSPDMKTVYSGHSSGSLHCHRLNNRSVFRAAHQKLTKFDGEIVQLDTLQGHVLVATSLSAHLYHVDSGTIQQVGKKVRTSPSPLGACYIQDSEGGSAFIVAARPNGRLWEANLVGVVYKTHQYRQSGHIPRAPPISYRNPFPTDYTEFDGLHPENQDVSLHKIHVIRVENGRLLIVSTCGSRICIVEMETSKCILSSELDFEILDVSTCGNDVFVLLADSKGLRKYSVFERQKCVEKLNLKGFFVQSAQTILFCSPHFSFPSPIISKTIEGLLTMSRKKETERLQQLLQKILDDRKASQSMYDNMEELERRESLKGAKNKKKEGEETQRNEEMSKRLPSGVHRVLHTVQCSGYDDDFSFSTPQALRERSRSSPCTPESPIPTAQPFEKRASEPSSLELRQEFWRKNGTPDVVEEDILHRARQILEENSEKLVEKESLRTLLQLEGVKRDEIRFTPTVTIGNAAKALAELALAVPVDLSTIWNNKEALAMTSSEKTSEEKSEKSEKSTSAKKPTIVKVVRPGIRPAAKKEKPVATVSPRSPNDDVIEEPADDVASNNVTPISEEMRRKQDEMWLDLRLSHIKKQSTATPTDSNVPKSDTDYTITTEGTTTPEGTATPSGIWTNPLDEEDDVKTPTTSSGTTTSTSSEFNCSTCGMHRSWAAASLLMAVSSGAEVIKDDFKRHGSIPQTSGDWERLLRHVASTEEPEDLNSICPRCEMSLSTVERVCIEGWRGNGMVVEEGIRPNFERIFERCMNSSKEKLETIVARREEQEPMIQNSGKMRIEEEHRIQKDQDSETPTQKLPEKLQNLTLKSKENPPTPTVISDFSSPAHLRWLQAVPLKTLLALAVFTLGKKAVIQIISSDEQWIAKRMKPADWCSIVVMGTREMVFKDLLGVKTITSVLDSVGASGWVMPRKKKLPTTPARKMSPISSNSQNSQNPGQISSWIVDTNGKCPMCTLPIKMIVGGTDRGVVSYYCGHVFHKMCLAGRFTTGCIACRVKARRAAAAARSSTTSSPAASPVMSPRHQRLG